MPSAVLTHHVPGTADLTNGRLTHACYNRRCLASHTYRTDVTIDGPERRLAANL
jgi:hypothetical protein